MRVNLTRTAWSRYTSVSPSNLTDVTPPEETPDAEPTVSKKGWARGAATRGLVALPLVAGLVTAGWLLSGGNDRPAAVAPPTPRPQVAADTIGGGAGPSVLEVSSPVQAQEPAKAGSQLETWAQGLSGPLDVPAQALMGYATGELTLRTEQPACHLSWVTLAGIGKSTAATDGRSGPLKLSASQWKRWSHGIPGTAKPSVNDVRDASIAAGRALCATGADLGGGNGWWDAVGTYESAPLFRQQVLGNAQLYATLSLDPAKANAPSTRATRFALGQLGLPYVWGGNGPDAGAAGFDCSGLTKASYEDAGVELPRTADSQFRSVPAVPPTQPPQLGDLVFYGNAATNIHHVGLYLGNGLMINAPTEGQAIQIHTYHSKGDDYVGAGRPAN
jgi:cell wall-associated NlpC family hydrolase